MTPLGANHDPRAAGEVHASYEAVVLANKHPKLLALLSQCRTDGLPWQETLYRLRVFVRQLQLPLDAQPSKMRVVTEQTVEAGDDDD